MNLSGNQGQFPVLPLWLRVGIPTLLKFFSITAFLLGGLLWVVRAYGIAQYIPPDAVCAALGASEGCQWQVVRRVTFKLTAVVNDTGGSAFVLTRGHTVIGSAPLPGDLGPVTEETLLQTEGQLSLHLRYVMGSAALQAAILDYAQTTGVAYVSSLYALRVGDGTADDLGTALSAKVRVEIAR